MNIHPIKLNDGWMTLSSSSAFGVWLCVQSRCFFSPGEYMLLESDPPSFFDFRPGISPIGGGGGGRGIPPPTPPPLFLLGASGITAATFSTLSHFFSFPENRDGCGANSGKKKRCRNQCKVQAGKRSSELSIATHLRRHCRRRAASARASFSCPRPTCRPRPRCCSSLSFFASSRLR